MNAPGRWTVAIPLLAFVVVGAVLSLLFSQLVAFPGARATPALPAKAVSPGAASLLYNPPRPEEAPADIREAVLLGAKILQDPKRYAGAFVGNQMKCTNCHFNAGISSGGRGGGLSLVGVAATYPKYRERQHAAVDLVIRTNDCFERSMNGKALPTDGKEMVSILTYYQWIAKGLPIYADVPWLGLKKIGGGHPGDTARGGAVYAANCAVCHGADGQGTPAAPPVWGDGAYNDGAGMARPDTLAAFALLNMPRGNQVLSEAAAVDVAAYVNSRPRPRFKK